MGRTAAWHTVRGERIKSRAKLGFAVKDIIDNMQERSFVYRADKEMMRSCLQTMSCLGLQAVKHG